MQPILAAFLTFAAVWLAHLMLWRVRLPLAQLKTLLVLFFFGWCGAIGFAWVSNWSLLSLGEGSTLNSFSYFSLFYWAAALCYVVTYSAMEGDSPTLSLTRHLHRRGAEGVSHEEIEEFFRQRPVLGVSALPSLKPCVN